MSFILHNRTLAVLILKFLAFFLGRSITYAILICQFFRFFVYFGKTCGFVMSVYRGLTFAVSIIIFCAFHSSWYDIYDSNMTWYDIHSFDTSVFRACHMTWYDIHSFDTSVFRACYMTWNDIHSFDTSVFRA